MLPEIKIEISSNDKLLKSVSKTTEKKDIIKSLEEFQTEANAALTQLIEEMGESSGDHSMAAAGEEEGEDDDEAKDNKGKEDAKNDTVNNAEDPKNSRKHDQNGDGKPKKKKRCG